MSGVKELCFCLKNYKQDFYLTEFVDVSKYKSLRMSYFASTKISVHLIWSLDGKVDNIINIHQGVPLSWKSEKIETVMDFVKIRVLACAGNTLIDVNLHTSGRFAQPSEPREVPISVDCSAVSIPKQLESQPTVTIVESKLPESKPESKSESKPESKPKDSPRASPRVFKRFSGFSKFRKHSADPPMRDDRLPALLLDGQMLVVKDKKFKTVSPGFVGQVLAVNADNEIEWEYLDEIYRKNK